MHPLSDKDLDRLSREAAEQYDVDQSPSGWEHLEQRLNKELPPQKEKDRRRFLWIFFLFLLLSGSGLVWMLADKNGNETAINTGSSSGNPKNEASPPIAPSSETKATENKKNENGNRETIPVTEKKTGSDNATPSNNDLSASTTPIAEENKLTENNIKTKPVIVKEGSVSTKRSGSSRKKTIAAVAGSETSIKKSATKGTDPLTSNPEKKEPVNKDNSQNSVPAPIVPVPDKPIVQTDPGSVNNKTNAPSTDKDPQPAPATVNPATASSEKKKGTAKEKTKDRWAFSLLTGIDKSSIHGTGSNKLGYNFGAQVSYNLSNRWSLNTGFIYTKKNYSAEGEDFHPPKHYWTYYVTLNSLDGNCVMWDLPLNVRYNISIKTANTWFVSTGLSSYIMRKQAYTYDYIYNNTPTIGNWETNSQENEWFKIVNFSAGYERALNKSWSVQAEPFLKIPLSGVGFGSMDMSSYGIVVGIKYKPVFNKTKTTPTAKIP